MSAIERTWSWFPKRLLSNARFLNLSLEARCVLLSMYARADESGSGPIGIAGMVQLGIVNAPQFDAAIAELTGNGATGLITITDGQWVIADYKSDDPNLTKARASSKGKTKEVPAPTDPAPAAE